MYKLNYFVGILCGLITLSSCTENGENQGTNKFDRTVMLKNIADNLITPAYATIQKDAVELQKTTAQFAAAPTSANLEVLKATWTKAYTNWQYANGYNFGPAAEEGIQKSLQEEIGTWPVNTIKVEELIAQNDTAFQSFARDTRGYLAMEYLIFGDNALDQLQKQKNRVNYLIALSNFTVKRINPIANQWISGSYASGFKTDAATSVGSATSSFYNEFVKNYEAFKNFKIALPLGKRVGQTQAEPAKVEAFYSGQSLAMLKAHFTSCKNIWYGKGANGVDGVGIKEYLEAVEGGPALIILTEAQLTQIEQALNAIPTTKPLSTLITNNDPSLNNLQIETQKLVRFFKSDLSSLLGIAITFASGDGD